MARVSHLLALLLGTARVLGPPEVRPAVLALAGRARGTWGEQCAPR
ncbi:hypothetical protein ACTXJ3_16135 [Brachybacterium paraconglomeratum]